jgi:hypothetical protein
LNLPQLQAEFRGAACGFSIDIGLFLAEGVALPAAARSRLDTAQAAPAMTLAGGKEAHLGLVMMYTAAVAEQRFSHRNLGVSKMAFSLSESCCGKMTGVARLGGARIVTALQHGLTKLNVRLPWNKPDDCPDRR